MKTAKWQKEEETSGATVRPQPTDAQPLRSRTLGRGRRETLVERSLATVREAHQKVLAMAAALEGEIERLNPPPSISWGQGQDQKVETTGHVEPWSRRGGIAGCDLAATLLPITHLERVQSLVRGQQPLGTWTWESHQNWSQRWPTFLEGQWKILRKKTRRCPLSPQLRSSTSGCHGRWKHVKCLVGGGSWWQYWRWGTTKS